MRIRIGFLIIILITFVSTGFTNLKNNDCVKEGTILSFSSLKCGGCWGWSVKVGSDTIKTRNLPFTTDVIHQNIIFQLKLPQKVKINVEESKVKQHSVYHQVNCIEFVPDQKCTEIVWHQFIEGKPDTNYVRTTERVAKKWGFKIHYEFGSCENTEADRRMAKECEQKNIVALDCLSKRYVDNWQEKFFEQVEKEK